MLSTLLYTVFALTAFAANSILCRLALAEQLIDPASFTAIRLMSGALTLVFIISFKLHKPSLYLLANAGSWRSALALFAYAVGFSFAYQWLDTGTGALILFASVQLTMIFLSVFSGHRFKLQEWLGIGLAFTGFVYLILPGVSAPSPKGAILMAISGIAWGIYTIRGKASTDALTDTTGNFVRTLPMLVLLAPILILTPRITIDGSLYAIASGALASGIGYAIWYKVLPRLVPGIAAVSQLSVPVLAALGGLVLLNEQPEIRLIIASLVILGGIALVIAVKRA